MAINVRKTKNRRTQHYPSNALVEAEKVAKRCAKTLLSRNKCLKGSSVCDAVKLAKTIEALASFGQSQPAAQAIVIASLLENLVPQLVREMDSLFAQKN